MLRLHPLAPGVEEYSGNCKNMFLHLKTCPPKTQASRSKAVNGSECNEPDTLFDYIVKNHIACLV